MQVFSPGCALLMYKPHLSESLHIYLNEHSSEEIPLHEICCHHDPKLESGTQIITVCSGCTRRFLAKYEGMKTISLWEVLADLDDFPFPDYGGIKMSIQDACPTRFNPNVHNAIRTLLKKMNIECVEPLHTRENTICCGDEFYGKMPIEQVHEKMRSRAKEMPCEDVCVYCVACINAMFVGGARPRYIIDLLFNENTNLNDHDIEEWHKQLKVFIEEH